MPEIYLLKDTANFLGGRIDNNNNKISVDLKKIRCASRSLLMDKFVNPGWKDKDRKQFFKIVAERKDKELSKAFLDRWKEDVALGGRLGVKEEGYFTAALKSRMMVNMSGGVMENAGLCLHRFCGEPYIPGSAVKGCARSMAIQYLYSESDKEKKIFLLSDIAFCFGWGDKDWKKDSDFEWACRDVWNADGFMNAVKQNLWKRIFPSKKNEYSEKKFSKLLKSFCGSVIFFPAFPTAPCDIELDVVTTHHKRYYSGEEKKYADVELDSESKGGFYISPAPDIEDPVPVIFPAVKADTEFIFALTTTNGCTEILNKAKEWLKQGIEELGIGAKTNAGYGWFSCGGEGESSSIANNQEEKEEPQNVEIFEKSVNQEKEKLLAISNNDELKGVINKSFHSMSLAERKAVVLLFANEKQDLWSQYKNTRKGKQKYNEIIKIAQQYGVNLS